MKGRRSGREIVRPWTAPKCIGSRGTSLAFLAAARNKVERKGGRSSRDVDRPAAFRISRDSSGREPVFKRKSEGKRCGCGSGENGTTVRSSTVVQLVVGRGRSCSVHRPLLLLEKVNVALCSTFAKHRVAFSRSHSSTNHLENVSPSLSLRNYRTQSPFPRI